MSDDLVKRMRESGSRREVELHDDREEAADRIDELEGKLDEKKNQLDSARYSVSVLEKRVNTFCEGWGVADKRRIEVEAKLEKAEKIIAAAKEMYETAMLTGGGSPEAWVNHVRTRNAFASTLAELKAPKND